MSTPDELLAKARAGMGEWLDAEDRSDAEFEAAQRMYQGIYDLDRLLSSGAPLPSAWARGDSRDLIDTKRVNELLTSDLNDEVGRHNQTRNRLAAARDEIAGRDARIARLQAELDAASDVPVEYVVEAGLAAAMAADPHRDDGALLRCTDGERKAWAWKAATRIWEPVT